MTADKNPVIATVVVLTFNGERYLAELLDAVLSQQIDAPFEVLVIDSGSTDSTLDIVRARPRVRLHEIPNVEFGHGRTRNLGIQMSRGEYTVFLTHDATPSSRRWLMSLLQPMRADSRVAAVLGPQKPRPTCFPLLKYEMSAVFGSQGSSLALTIYSADLVKGDDEGMRHAGFFSDVNGAVRTDVVRHAVPYRDVAYAEDQLLGRDLLLAGYWKAFAPRGEVIHSNDLTLREYRKRLFDEAVALRRIGLAGPPVSALGALLRFAKGTLMDTIRLLRDADMRPWQRARWIVVNPVYQATKWWSLHHAAHADIDDEAVHRKNSLEASRRAHLLDGTAAADRPNDD